MKDIKILLAALIICLSILICGCGNDSAMTHDASKMGPAPTNAPAGSPYHKDTTPQQAQHK